MAKTLAGVVSSDRADKTIVVTVRTRKTHPIYKKQYTVNKKFMAHDEQNEAKVGDQVIICETRPISARKRFTLEKITEKAVVRHIEAVETEKSKATKKKSETVDTDLAEAPTVKPVRQAQVKGDKE